MWSEGVRNEFCHLTSLKWQTVVRYGIKNESGKVKWNVAPTAALGTFIHLEGDRPFAVYVCHGGHCRFRRYNSRGSCQAHKGTLFTNTDGRIGFETTPTTCAWTNPTFAALRRARPSRGTSCEHGFKIDAFPPPLKDTRTRGMSDGTMLY